MKTKKIEINKSLDIFFLFSLTSASLNDIMLYKILTIFVLSPIFKGGLESLSLLFTALLFITSLNNLIAYLSNQHILQCLLNI